MDLGEDTAIQQDGKPRVKGLTYTEVKEGVRKWTLSAEGARIDESKGSITLSKVYVEFYPEGGGIITLKGDEGVYFQKEKIVTLQGNVFGRTHDGVTLKTDKLTYSENNQVVDTESWVTITGKRYQGPRPRHEGDRAGRQDNLQKSGGLHLHPPWAAARLRGPRLRRRPGKNSRAAGILAKVSLKRKDRVHNAIESI